MIGCDAYGATCSWGTRAAFVLAALTAWKARHGMLFTYILRGMASLLYLYRLLRNTSYAAAIPYMAQPEADSMVDF